MQLSCEINFSIIRSHVNSQVVVEYSKQRGAEQVFCNFPTKFCMPRKSLRAETAVKGELFLHDFKNSTLKNSSYFFFFLFFFSFRKRSPASLSSTSVN